jgi:hypothetical protein
MQKRDFLLTLEVFPSKGVLYRKCEKIYPAERESCSLKTSHIGYFRKLSEDFTILNVH